MPATQWRFRQDPIIKIAKMMPKNTRHPVPLPMPKNELVSRMVTCWGGALRMGLPHPGQAVDLSETLLPHSGQLMMAMRHG